MSSQSRQTNNTACSGSEGQFVLGMPHDGVHTTAHCAYTLQILNSNMITDETVFPMFKVDSGVFLLLHPQILAINLLKTGMMAKTMKIRPKL